MRRTFCLAFCAWFGLGAPAQAALAAGWPEPVRIAAPLPPATAPNDAYNVKTQPLPKPYLDLLARNKYVQRDDGTVWPPDASTAVTQNDMPFLLHRLESGARLQA